MEFELPGQLRGPECRPLMKVAIGIRKELNPWFQALHTDIASQLTIVLRIDGSLGSFGPEGIENIKKENNEIECDLVIADMGWKTQNNQQIGQLLRTRIHEAILACLDEFNVNYNKKELANTLQIGT